MTTYNRNLVIALVFMAVYAVAVIAFNVPWQTMLPLFFGAALTADRDTLVKDGSFRGYPVLNNTTIFKGAFVALNASGYLVNAADAASLRVVGVAHEKVISPSTDAAGAKKCRVKSGGSYLFPATSITQAMVGAVMYIVDNQTFDDTVGTNTVVAGRLAEFVSTTSGYVFIPDGGVRAAGAATAADLIS